MVRIRDWRIEFDVQKGIAMLMLDHCSRSGDGMSRRGLLYVGTLALGGLTLTELFRLRAVAGPNSARAKSVVMIHLSGGPSHLDMYDMKPLAPVEYRGEFSPIRTNVSGIEICELMPMQASIADKFAILRGAQIANLHTGNCFYSGFPWQESPRASVPGEARRPALGSIVSRLRPGAKEIPPYVSIENHFDWERAYYAGVEHEPVRVGGSSPREAIENMGRHRDVTAVRLDDRHDLLQNLDAARRELELGESASGVDRFITGPLHGRPARGVCEHVIAEHALVVDIQRFQINDGVIFWPLLGRPDAKVGEPLPPHRGAQAFFLLSGNPNQITDAADSAIVGWDFQAINKGLELRASDHFVG